MEQVEAEGSAGCSDAELERVWVRAHLEGRVVLVSGAGGSIGAELCRQIGRWKPDRLILLGKGPNSIQVLQSELKERYPELALACVVGDIGSATKMQNVFGQYTPTVVFHGAGYKSVPLMEENPEEAVLTNVFGTRNVAEAALRHGCERVVMLSCTEAVEPASVLGAAKRVCELMVLGMARCRGPVQTSGLVHGGPAGEQGAPGGMAGVAACEMSKPNEEGSTQFIVVRFGNVLRSQGSLVTVLESQITAGGPVTLRHPEMRRSFISIADAARLLLYSGAIGRGGDLCILDVGAPVPIVDVAKRMIQMHGKVPYSEVDIQFTGMQPGDKLDERSSTDAEARSLRKVGRISVCRPDRSGADHVERWLPALREAALLCDPDRIVEVLRRMVPEYCPARDRYGSRRSVLGRTVRSLVFRVLGRWR